MVGRTNSSLCPVTILLQYIQLQGSRPGPLFHWANGTPLTRTRFVDEVRKALTEAGLPEHHYAGHSFRIGAATTAAVAGLEDSTIQTLGRWKSAAFLTYIRMSTGQLASLSTALASGNI